MRVYVTDFTTGVSQWDTKSDIIKEWIDKPGQVAALRLSVDETRILIGGNHRDLEIYDAFSGDQITAFETMYSDFYVTNLWLKGDRLIFTTDAGVLFDGLFEKIEDFRSHQIKPNRARW